MVVVVVVMVAVVVTVVSLVVGEPSKSKGTRSAAHFVKINAHSASSFISLQRKIALVSPPGYLVINSMADNAQQSGTVLATF